MESESAGIMPVVASQSIMEELSTLISLFGHGPCQLIDRHVRTHARTQITHHLTDIHHPSHYALTRLSVSGCMGDVRTSGIRLSPFLRVAVVTVSTRGPTVHVWTGSPPRVRLGGTTA